MLSINQTFAIIKQNQKYPIMGLESYNGCVIIQIKISSSRKKFQITTKREKK